MPLLQSGESHNNSYTLLISKPMDKDSSLLLLSRGWVGMLFSRDLDLLLNSGYTFRELDGSRITVLGGTGFIGQWLIGALNAFASNFDFSTEITIVTRDSKKAQGLFTGKLSIPTRFVEFDFVDSSVDLDKSDFFVNGATPSRNTTGFKNSDAVYSSSVNASKSIVQSAIKFANMPKVVNLSSGIVYGSQGSEVRNQAETSISLTPKSESGYLDAKLASELIFGDANTSGALSSISPRLYAFAGPGIVLNEHFAVGNFLRDGLDGKPILIEGNPETLRSYMYPTDLIIWILVALLNPMDLNVNIGSESPISMLDLAQLISDLTSKRGVKILNENQAASNYVPSTSTFRDVYGVAQTLDLEAGLRLWIQSVLNSKQN